MSMGNAEHDFISMSGPEMLNTCNDDARLWAMAFFQINPGVMDESLMITWFANAIEQSHAVRRDDTLQQRNAALVEALNKAMEMWLCPSLDVTVEEQKAVERQCEAALAANGGGDE